MQTLPAGAVGAAAGPRQVGSCSPGVVPGVAGGKLTLAPLRPDGAGIGKPMRGENTVGLPAEVNSPPQTPTTVLPEGIEAPKIDVPGSPFGPCAPVAPVAPVSPVRPVAPVAPRGPELPL